jgi:hypothetical protein
LISHHLPPSPPWCAGCLARAKAFSQRDPCRFTPRSRRAPREYPRRRKLRAAGCLALPEPSARESRIDEVVNGSRESRELECTDG